MRAATFAGGFNLLCWLIFTAKDITGEPNIEVHFVETAEIVPPPHRLEELYLAHKSFNQLKKLCALMFDKMIKSSEFPLGKSSSTPTTFDPQISIASTPTGFSHVPRAIVYKFDNKDDWLSVRCASFPPFYVSHETVNKNKHHWHIWVERPVMERYEFRLETFKEVKEVSDKNLENTTRLPSETHYFYRLDGLQRWYLCSEAIRVIMYEHKEIMYNSTPDEPQIYKIVYTNAWEEKYLGFKCHGSPAMMLRTGDKKNNETNVIYIALLQTANVFDSDEDLDDSDIALDIEE